MRASFANVQTPPVSKVVVVGTLTNERNGTQALPVGRRDEFHVVIPRAKLRGLRKGDRICVAGTIAEISYSEEGTAIVVVWSTSSG